MKKITVIYFLLFLIILTGCNSIKSNDQNITEEKAKQIVIDERSRECCGDAEIITIITKTNKYIIQWKIDSLKEEETDRIDKKISKIKAIKTNLDKCKIKSSG